MRDELEGGGPEPGGGPAAPPWALPGPRPPGGADSPVTPAGRSPGAGHGTRGTRGSRARRHSRPRGNRRKRLVLWAACAAAIAGLAVTLGPAVTGFRPRGFSTAQRNQIMAWEVGKRWRTWSPGRIFPQVIGYQLPGSAFGSGSSLPLEAERVGIAAQSSCRAATDPPASRVLADRGCQAMLRATYEDTTQTFAVTVGVAVLPKTPATEASAALHDAHAPKPWLRAVSFRRTPTAHFAGPGRKVGWSGAAGPYLVVATVGYADGRPWLSQGNDTYTQTEMDSLAAGVGHSVAARLGAAPPVPHCPGSPGC